MFSVRQVKGNHYPFVTLITFQLPTKAGWIRETERYVCPALYNAASMTSP